MVIDPPYGVTGGRVETSGMKMVRREKRYGLVDRGEAGQGGVLRLYAEALAEAYRVVRETGFVVVKCQDDNRRWMHIEIKEIAEGVGFKAEDLFVLVWSGTPAMRYSYQLHARKNHSYFWVFAKKRRSKWSGIRKG